MIPIRQNKIDDIEVNYYEEKPFIEVAHLRDYSKLQNQLLYLLFLDNYTDIFDTNGTSYSQLKEMIQFITSEAYTNLFRTAIRNELILLVNFIMAKKLISSSIINESFNSTEYLFQNKLNYFYLGTQNRKLCEYYLGLLNKNIIFIYSNIFPIVGFSKIIKYPIKTIDKFFTQFNWENMATIKIQQVPLEIFIKHIDNISYYTIDLLSVYLNKNEINTLLLIKEML